MSSSATTTSSATASATTTAAAELTAPASLKVVGIILAVVSGVLIGGSFVFKKKGLLRSQAGQVAGEGVAYLKSVSTFSASIPDISPPRAPSSYGDGFLLAQVDPLWWVGMIMMILGELCNFAAYAFVEAIVVTPLGALSVVISAILSSIFLKEKLSMFGWLGCGLCILGSVIIAMNGPQEQTVGQIRAFEKLFIAPGFLAYICTLIAISIGIASWFAPRYGSKNMIWYIMVCSMIGGISVSVTTGLGAAIVTSVLGDSQFDYWFIYFLFAFVAITLITEVFYLNKALALFNTAMVTPTYYVIFTFFSMVTTIVLFQGLDASASQIITIVMGFLVICVGITILQLSKVDPVELNDKLDRRSTLLLQAARQQTENVEEKSLAGAEDPGMDALRGSFGTFGSIIRARTARRMSQSSQHSTQFSRVGGSTKLSGLPSNPRDNLHGMQRHQLWDAPVPRLDRRDSDAISMTSQPGGRKPTIKFGDEDVVHQYHATGKDGTATHESRPAQGGVFMSPASHAGTLPSVQETVSISTNDSSRTTLGSLPTSFDRDLERDPEVYGMRTAPPRIGLDTGVYYDPFAPSPSTTTLASFPSPSPLDPEVERERIRGQTRRHSRQSSTRSYPRGDREEDAEESMHLWQGNSEDEEEEVAPANARNGGIRLVPGSVTSRF
ncbi:magnesium transporter NIPA-domain-containing protein [Amylostereum chailletii]|nr:magnesium transporter NIPA-domain-containing protein [Amylostereum chailletii]